MADHVKRKWSVITNHILGGRADVLVETNWRVLASLAYTFTKAPVGRSVSILRRSGPPEDGIWDTVKTKNGRLR